MTQLIFPYYLKGKVVTSITERNHVTAVNFIILLTTRLSIKKK